MLVDALPVDDKALSVLVADGEEAAFKKLVHKYGGLIYPYLLRFTRSATMADDLSQEIFLKVWIHRDKLPMIEDTTAWIFRIAANTARSWLKKKLREKRHMEEYHNGSATSSAQDMLDFRETQKLLLQAIQSLPPRRRQIYIMQRIEGKSIATIAEELNVSVSTVKNTVMAAVQAIRVHIDKFELLLLFMLVYLRK